MSRIGRMPIAVPPGVEVSIKSDEITVKGPKGELSRRFNPDLSITLQDSKLLVARPSDSRLHRSLHGLTRTLLANMIEGVTKGFEKTLDIVGAGYRAEKSGDKLILRIGFSHQVEILPIPGISLGLEGATRIKVSGINKELVGETTNKIRKIHPADSYKGKGLKYTGKQLRLKPGKAVGKKAQP